MKIVLNGKPHDIEATRLDMAIEELGYEAPYVATAVNGDFVPISNRTATELAEADRLEVVAPRQGG